MKTLHNIARACGLLSLCAVVSGCIVPTQYNQVGQGTNHPPVIVTDGSPQTQPSFIGVQAIPSRTTSISVTIVAEDDDDTDTVYFRIFFINVDGTLLQLRADKLTPTGTDHIRESTNVDALQVCATAPPNSNASYLLVIGDREFVGTSNSTELQTPGPGHTDENHWEFACP